MREISMEALDARFDELMALAEAGESFAIRREGKIAAVLRPVEPLIESAQPRILEQSPPAGRR